jgi:hypothetical protein
LIGDCSNVVELELEFEFELELELINEVSEIRKL